MNLLLVRMSSLGDVLHALPALTDALRQIPELQVDWVVEEGFAQVPGWHSAVHRTIPVTFRRWRKTPIRTLRSGEWARLRETIRASRYDRVVDAQGLVKSALLTRMARGKRWGFDRASARESLAALAYQHRCHVP